MKVRYVGPSPDIEIADTGQVLERGATVEVPDELGARLCEQSTWEAMKAAKTKTEEV